MHGTVMKKRARAYTRTHVLLDHEEDSLRNELWAL